MPCVQTLRENIMILEKYFASCIYLSNETMKVLKIQISIYTTVCVQRIKPNNINFHVFKRYYIRLFYALSDSIIFRKFLRKIGNSIDIFPMKN